MTYLLNTFSPSMLEEGQALIKPVNEDWFRGQLRKGFTSAVGHAITAEILSKRLGISVKFNRESVLLKPHDMALIAVPQVRFNEAREYTLAEVQKAKFKFFIVLVSWNFEV